jgi:hypothetical protein
MRHCKPIALLYPAQHKRLTVTKMDCHASGDLKFQSVKFQTCRFALVLVVAKDMGIDCHLVL